MPELELADYVAEVTTAREAQGRSDHLELLLGIEADYIPDEQEYTRGLLSRYPFDVVLGSVHMIGDWAFDDPDLTDRYAEWDIGLLWDRYFIEVVAAARSGLFDVMGHVDLVKKFRFFPDGDLHERYVALARALTDTGVAIEVNTAGLRKPCAELYPALPLLKEFRRAGVPATIGSDAHTPSEVGFGYDLAADALREAGYDTVAVFKQRRLREVVL
jgi:histidinol-phosphatase (PHP family)